MNGERERWQVLLALERTDTGAAGTGSRRDPGRGCTAVSVAVISTRDPAEPGGGGGQDVRGPIMVTSCHCTTIIRYTAHIIMVFVLNGEKTTH